MSTEWELPEIDYRVLVYGPEDEVYYDRCFTPEELEERLPDIYHRLTYTAGYGNPTR